MNTPSSSTVVEFQRKTSIAVEFQRETLIAVEFQRETSIAVEEYSLETKVCVGLTAPVLVFLILFLNWGILYYEKFGHDPQKRNLYNMMLSSFCMGFGVAHIFVVVFCSIRIIFGPFDASNSFAFLVVLKIFLTFNRLCILEVGIYKVLAAYFPKAIIGMNDDWYHCLLNCWNVMISVIISITTSWDIAPWIPLVNYGYIPGYGVRLFIGQEEYIDYEL